MGSYYYGEYKQNPACLTIIYIFDKNTDLEYAKNIKLTNELESVTKNELIRNGYPAIAFESENDFDITCDEESHDSVTFYNWFIEKMNSKCVSISFVANEDILDKADGNIFLYLK